MLLMSFILSQSSSFFLFQSCFDKNGLCVFLKIPGVLHRAPSEYAANLPSSSRGCTRSIHAKHQSLRHFAGPTAANKGSTLNLLGDTNTLFVCGCGVYGYFWSSVVAVVLKLIQSIDSIVSLELREETQSTVAERIHFHVFKIQLRVDF